MLSALFVAILALSSDRYAAALKDLPDRAKGGRAYATQQQRNSRQQQPLKASVAQTWQAPVDHFDPADNRTFAQRFFVNDEYWVPGEGPVFFEISGEGTLSGPPGGYVKVLGERYSALLISLEHRFYGESIPEGNLFTDNYNRHLSVEQALADLASFTAYFQQQQTATEQVPWIIFGGSYSGGLSSWYRAAYPDSSTAALSSSGVVNCIIDYFQFDMQVSAAAGNKCGDQIKLVSEAFQRTIGTTQHQQQQFKTSSNNKSDNKSSNMNSIDEASFQQALQLFYCEADMSVNDFYYMIADSWSMSIQYDGKTQLCAALADISSDSSDQQRMQTFADFSNEFWGKDFCSSGFYNTKALSDPARWDTNSRSWRFQTCSQVSYFNTAPASGSLRAASVDLNYHLQQCEEIFKQHMFPSSVQFNDKFGGQFPAAEKVFYSDFSDDPWQQASVWFAPSAQQPYFYSSCSDCGHCMDLHTPDPSTDPLPLQQSRAEFEEYLQQWLQQ